MDQSLEKNSIICKELVAILNPIIISILKLDQINALILKNKNLEMNMTLFKKESFGLLPLFLEQIIIRDITIASATLKIGYLTHLTHQ